MDTPTTLYVFVSILLLALLSFVAVLRPIVLVRALWHTLLLTIIASITKLSTKMVRALSNKSQHIQWVSEGTLPKLMGSNHMDVSDGHNGG